MKFAVFFILLVVVLAGPFITIWALNHLFGLGIENTLSSWLAVAWLSAIVYGSTVSRSK